MVRIHLPQLEKRRKEVIKMKLSKTKKKEFAEVSEPLMSWLHENEIFATAYVDDTSAHFRKYDVTDIVYSLAQRELDMLLDR